MSLKKETGTSRVQLILFLDRHLKHMNPVQNLSILSMLQTYLWLDAVFYLAEYIPGYNLGAAVYSEI